MRIKGEIIDYSDKQIEINCHLGLDVFQMRTFPLEPFKALLNLEKDRFVDITTTYKVGQIITTFTKGGDYTELFKQRDFFDKYGDDLLPE
jgi:hypothetical protein